MDAPDRHNRPALYGAGALGASMLLQTILLWLLYCYAPPTGAARLAPAWMGLALGGGRVVNALSNPPVAFWSDRLQTRWGRRRPFIAVGAPVLVACFILLWFPPALHAGPLFAYVLAVLACFFFCFSLVMNPYAALLPDLAPGPGRVVFASWQAGASVGGVGVAIIASTWLIDHAGFGGMGIAVGVAALAMLWTVAIGVREPAQAIAAAPPAFWQELGDVLRDRTFRIYVVSLTLLWVGASTVNSSIVYVITVLMALPRNAVGLVLGMTFLCTLGVFPFLARLTRAIGTPRAMRWTLGTTTLIVPLIGAVGLRGVPFTPAAQGFVLVLLAAAPLAGLLVLPNTLLADIAEADRELTGERREAMYYAVQGLILNAASAGSSVLLGALLALGDSPGHDVGLRLIPVVGGACTLLALLAFLPFPTSPRRVVRGAPSR